MEIRKLPWLPYAIGAVFVLAVCGAIFFWIISGKARRDTPLPQEPVSQTTSTEPVSRVPRRLDGVLVPEAQSALAPFAVMVENHPEARPLSGVSKANVVIEAPVEGGITRFMLLFDPMTSVEEVGPIRSARPYYVDWALGWRAAYFHVGGSPEALAKIGGAGASFINVDEMGRGQYFWRSTSRGAPHNTYTDQERMQLAVSDLARVSGTAPVAWHVLEHYTTSTATSTFRVTYGGSYNVSWAYDASAGRYVRSQAGKLQKDKDGSQVVAENVFVLKTEQQVLDDIGRLKIRTTGSGEVVGYRLGQKHILRWRRGANEPIRFEGSDGVEFLPIPGKTWIHITTDDKTFAGL